MELEPDLAERVRRHNATRLGKMRSRRYMLDELSEVRSKHGYGYFWTLNARKGDTTTRFYTCWTRPERLRSCASSTVDPRTGTYTRIQKCYEARGAHCAIATTVLFTAIRHANEPHTTAYISSRRPRERP